MTTTDRPTVRTAAPAERADEEASAAAERRVHAAESWLHATTQSGVGEWVAGASALLHDAIEEYFRLGGTSRAR